MKLPPVRQLRELLWHAEERQRIYIKREAGEPWPWTTDPVFQRHRFCCSYREDDRVTKWIREHWREPYRDHPNLWFAMAVARQINWPLTLDLIGFPDVWDPRRVQRTLDKQRDARIKIFTSAYLIGGGIPKGVTKTKYIIKDVLHPLWKHVNAKGLWQTPSTGEYVPTTLESAFNWLRKFHGFGNFISYEVITDLRHTRYLCGAPDINTWANPGPGAKRGLNRLYVRDLNAPSPQAHLMEEMIAVSKWIVKNRNTSVLPTWELRDTEHLLCEYDKRKRAQERVRENRTIGLEKFRSPGLL